MGYLLDESGRPLLDEAGGYLLDEAGQPPFASSPQLPLDLKCQLDLSGTWTDVTSYTYQREGSSPPVSITRGKPDESSTANPATATWQLNNRDGRFSPKNPLSPYFGSLGRNTPVRWSVPAQSAYLRLEAGNSDRAFAADGTPLHVTGSIEIRIGLRLTDWQGCVLAAKYDNSLPSWYFLLNSDGTLTFGWFDSGGTQRSAASDAPVPFTSGDMALRVTLDASVGTLAFYTSSSIDGSYTQLGDAFAMTGGAATSVRAGNAPLVAGWSANLTPAQLLGRIYELRVYNGIGGSVAADGVFSGQAAGATSWADSAGNTWTVAGGAEVSDRDYRFHGEMSALPPRWDVTGTDHWVAAAAGGPLRRLSQGTNNATSALKRAIGLLSGQFAPVAYWPMEDGTAAAQFGPAIGPNAMKWTGGPPKLAADSSFIASAPLPELGGAVLTAGVPPYSGATAWALRFVFKLGSTLPASQSRLLLVATTGACSYLEVFVDTDGTLSLGGWDATGAQVISISEIVYPQSGAPALWSLEATQSGGSVQYALVAVAPGASSGNSTTATVAGVFGNVYAVRFNSDGVLPDTVVGHVYLQTAWESLFSLGSPLNAWTGETAAARYARLCGENGYQARILGSPAHSALMGPQGQATLDALLKECEAADLGQQYEPRQVLGLGYRTLVSMLNQAPALALDYSQSQPGGVNGSPDDGGLDPTYDDQRTANDWTVTRGGSSGSQGATWQVQLNDGSAMSISDPPAGVGDYAKTATVNVASDAQVPDIAGWLVHTGTVDDERWPVIPVNLARSEMAALQAACLALEIGDYAVISNLPNVIVYDPAKQAVLGMKEAFGGFHWTHEYNAVPESPYEVIVLGDAVYGRVDTDGSSLASSAASGATSLSVATAGTAPLWTTSAGDFPFDVNVAGERVTVTNITGSSSPQAFTVTRSVNGVVKAQSAGADVRLWFPPVLAVA